jgi:hypothetical protein
MAEIYCNPETKKPVSYWESVKPNDTLIENLKLIGS